MYSTYLNKVTTVQLYIKLTTSLVSEGMEKAKQDAFDSARLQVIKHGYERAFECINEGLTIDEAGDKARALELYKRGRQHLLRAISVPSQGGECTGGSWESARQMQQKMQETLNNITTRLAILETSSDLASAPPLSAITESDPAAEGLYPGLPTKDKPERSAPPNILSSNGDSAAGAVGGKPSCSGAGLPLSPTRQPVGPAEQPPAYSPQAADGHLSISYGTDEGEMSMVGDEFYSRTSNTTPSPQSMGEEGEELLYIPHGVQIFFVTPEGQVSAPSYPGYLRLVKFTSDHSDSTPNRPPAFLQVRGDTHCVVYVIALKCSLPQSLRGRVKQLSWAIDPMTASEMSSLLCHQFFLCPLTWFCKMSARLIVPSLTVSHRRPDIVG